MARSMMSVVTGSVLAAAAALGGWSAPAWAQEQRFFDWSTVQFPPDEYERRRQRMMERIGAAGGGLYLASSGDGRSGGETFRPADDFLYFTGAELPNSVLVLDPDARAVILFGPRRDQRFENPSRPNDFPGRPLLDDPDVAARLAIQDWRPAAELHDYVATVAEAGRTVWIDAGRPGEAGVTEPLPFTTWDTPSAFAAYLATRVSPARMRNAYDHVARLRMVKSPREVEAMRRAARVTMEGIRRAARFVADGIDERTLEGELEAAFKRAGAQRLAFASIIKSGPNSLWPWRILASHYDRRNRTMHDGDLVIFDVGAELDYYASDVGRTFPVSGRFTARQREILEMEVRVADAIIAAVRPGATFADLQRAAVAAIPEAHRPYMQTGLFFGHHVGLAVGDPSLPEVPLEPGMVFTVEPWYYNHDEGIAVFTEDEVLVTESGAEVLTASLPRDPDGLERLVAGR